MTAQNGTLTRQARYSAKARRLEGNVRECNTCGCCYPRTHAYFYVHKRGKDGRPDLLYGSCRWCRCDFVRSKVPKRPYRKDKPPGLTPEEVTQLQALTPEEFQALAAPPPPPPEPDPAPVLATLTEWRGNHIPTGYGKIARNRLTRYA